MPESKARRGRPIQTHCKRGHELTPENTYTYEFIRQPSGKVSYQRNCKACYEVRDTAPVEVSADPATPCDFPDCGRRSRSSGLCHAHETQQRRGYELKPIGVKR